MNTVDNANTTVIAAKTDSDDGNLQLSAHQIARDTARQNGVHTV